MLVPILPAKTGSTLIMVNPKPITMIRTILALARMGTQSFSTRTEILAKLRCPPNLKLHGGVYGCLDLKGLLSTVSILNYVSLAEEIPATNEACIPKLVNKMFSRSS